MRRSGVLLRGGGVRLRETSGRLRRRRRGRGVGLGAEIKWEGYLRVEACEEQVEEKVAYEFRANKVLGGEYDTQENLSCIGK